LESCAAWNMRNPLEKISTDLSSHFFCLNAVSRVTLGCDYAHTFTEA
jgi:hypothetical protein